MPRCSRAAAAAATATRTSMNASARAGSGRRGGGAARAVPGRGVRRRFLTAVGAALRSPRSRACFRSAPPKEAFAQGAGKPEKTKLKVGFIPITCATPIIMAHPMGFYAKHGLDVEVVKTAGWAVIRDKTLNKEYDAAHMLSPMPLAITLGAGATPCPTPCRRSRTSTARRSRSRSSTRTSATRRPGRASSSPCRSTTRCTTTCCATTSPSTASIPDTRHPDPRRAAAGDGREPARRQHRRLPRARSVQPARGVRRRRLHPHAVEGDLGRPSVLRVRRASKEFVTTMPNTYRALLKAIIDATALRATRPRTARRSPRRSRRANYLNQPVTVVEQVLTGTLRRRPRQRAQGARPHRLRSVPVALVGGLDPDADEALGPASRATSTTRRSRARCSSPPTAAKLMKRSSGMTPPKSTYKSFTRDGQGVRPDEAGRVRRELRDQAGLSA